MLLQLISIQNLREHVVAVAKTHQVGERDAVHVEGGHDRSRLKRIVGTPKIQNNLKGN